jgi:hypothetical protein
MNATRVTTVLFAGGLLLTVVAPASAQIDDNRWLPFIGCWEATPESPEAGLLCFRAAPGGVEMTSVSDGEVVATETLVADGQPRPIVADGCDGTESVVFAEDGRRAFTRSDIACGNDPRSGTGVMALTARNQWIDVRSLEVQGEKVAWVQEYALVGFDRLAELGVTDPADGLETSIRAARVAAAGEIDLDDVREAVAALDSEAVVAWVAAQGDPFDVDGEQLLALADEGMPESVIDVVVAVSFPERFVVAPEQQIVEADMRPEGRRIPVRVGYRSYLGWDPFYADPYFGFGYRSRFGYGAFGYGYPGYYGGGYGYGYPGYGYGYPTYGPTVIRIERAPSGGRVVKGRGWRPGGSSDTGRSARPLGSSSGSQGPAARSSGSPAPSPSARSGGSQPDRTPPRRTARRRGGG